MSYAFVMTNNLDEWLSSAAVTSSQTPATAAADADDDENVSHAATNSSWTVSSSIMSVSISSSVSSRPLYLTQPISFTLSHLHVSFHSLTLSRALLPNHYTLQSV